MARIMLMADAIFDSRLGTIMGLNQSLGEKIIQDKAYTKKYTTRTSDFFGEIFDEITTDDYKEAYAKRNIDTLKRSVCTRFVREIARQLQRIDIRENLPGAPRSSITINTYPYEFTGDEKTELSMLLRGATGNAYRVNCVHIPYNLMTTQYIGSQWDAAIIYDFNTWFSNRDEQLTGMAKKQVTIVSPFLLTTLDIEEPQLKENPEQLANSLMFAMSGLFQLNLEKMDLFCFNDILPGTK